jgi:hypothetical protein
VQAIKEAEALEAKRLQSQKALEAVQRQKELELEHKRAAEAKARENAERLAREAAARLETMRSQWRESTALQQVCLLRSVTLLPMGVFGKDPHGLGKHSLPSGVMHVCLAAPMTFPSQGRHGYVPYGLSHIHHHELRFFL